MRGSVHTLFTSLWAVMAYWRPRPPPLVVGPRWPGVFASGHPFGSSEVQAQGGCSQGHGHPSLLTRVGPCPPQLPALPSGKPWSTSERGHMEGGVGRGPRGSLLGGAAPCPCTPALGPCVVLGGGPVGIQPRDAASLASWHSRSPSHSPSCCPPGRTWAEPGKEPTSHCDSGSRESIGFVLL